MPGDPALIHKTPTDFPFLHYQRCPVLPRRRRREPAQEADAHHARLARSESGV